MKIQKGDTVKIISGKTMVKKVKFCKYFQKRIKF